MPTQASLGRRRLGSRPSAAKCVSRESEPEPVCWRREGLAFDLQGAQPLGSPKAECWKVCTGRAAAPDQETPERAAPEAAVALPQLQRAEAHAVLFSLLAKKREKIKDKRNSNDNNQTLNGKVTGTAQTDPDQETLVGFRNTRQLGPPTRHHGARP